MLFKIFWSYYKTKLVSWLYSLKVIYNVNQHFSKFLYLLYATNFTLLCILRIYTAANQAYYSQTAYTTSQTA